MKKFENADVVMIDLTNTEFGIACPDNPDSEKTQVTIDGVDGWEQEFGQAAPSVQ